MSHRARAIAVARHVIPWASAVILAQLSVVAALAMQSPAAFDVDAAGSRVLIEVGRSGVFGFAGHDHEVLAPAVTGRVMFDAADWSRSAVSLRFDASALEVTGKGDPPSDVPKVQTVMLSDEVLDVKRFPTVAFTSRRVSAAASTSNAVDLVIEGDMTLHGQTRPLAIRAATTMQPDGLMARGAFTIRQTDFGITPVTAGGGTVRVKNDVRVQFVLRARRGNDK